MQRRDRETSVVSQDTECSFALPALLRVLYNAARIVDWPDFILIEGA
jgi:hypothetical protein